MGVSSETVELLEWDWGKAEGSRASWLEQVVLWLSGPGDPQPQPQTCSVGPGKKQEAMIAFVHTGSLLPLLAQGPAS